MSDIDTNLNNTEEISATKNVRLKYQKNVDENHLLESLQSGFISHNHGFHNHLAPSLLVNNPLQGKKILSALTEELDTCDAFDFSVAFINSEGLASLRGKLSYLAEHNIKGRILTSSSQLANSVVKISFSRSSAFS